MAAISGQTTVTTAGTEVILHADKQVMGPVAVKALTTNTGVMYVGNAGDGTVSSSTGYPLGAGHEIIFNNLFNLNQIWVDSTVNGEKVAWCVLDI